ncbi:E3 ubiquitin-protein ligase RNF4-like [Watersipora subatra]|uniref:E3 ubiquitin-protein ligase RNF4-like n=1 Tax=Watersipora subatra TaxID=2589382 RepID=UPI00355B9DBC
MSDSDSTPPMEQQPKTTRKRRDSRRTTRNHGEHSNFVEPRSRGNRRESEGLVEVISQIEASSDSRTASTDIIVLDESLPNHGASGEEVIDLTLDDSHIVTPRPVRKQGRRPPSTSDDAPLVAVRTPRIQSDADCMVIEKENKSDRQLSSEVASPYDPLTPKRKMISCPICMDHERTIRRTGRSMMSTTCGHIFCNECIIQTIARQKCCPACRKKLTKKTGIHPIFV